MKINKVFATQVAMMLIILSGIASYFVRPETPFRAVTQVYVPYQDRGPDGQAIGSAVEVIRCALDFTHHPYEITIVDGKDWMAVQKRVQSGELDGFFGALSADWRDEFAVLSVPIDKQRSYLIRLKTTTIEHTDPVARFAAKKGSGISSQIAGLKTISYVGNDNPEVVKALVEGKADYVYMDLKIFQWSARMNGIIDVPLQELVPDNDTLTTEHFWITPIADQPYGMYVSRKFLHEHPWFLIDAKRGLNIGIAKCRKKREENLGSSLPRNSASADSIIP